MLSGQVKQDLKNPWLRGILAVIAVTVAVNAGFIAYAFISPPNLVVNDYYEKGKSYFHDQQVEQKSASSAWRLQLMLPDKVRVQEPVTCRLYVMDHQGQPVHAGKVVLTAYRPSDAANDFRTELSLSDAGTFTAPVRFPLPGHWDLLARIDLDGHHFDTATRLFVEK